MARALAADPGLDVDSVTRKGKNGDGQDTFFVQAGGGRARGADARVPGDARTAVRLRRAGRSPTSKAISSRARSCKDAADFVAERGGGLLVLGGRSFAQRGLVRHAARRSAAGRAQRSARRPGARLARHRRPAGAQPRDADAGRRDASDHAHRRDDRRDAEDCGRRCRRWPRARRSAHRVPARRSWR